ncbi:MAG: hypothetical protein AAF202_06270, partial [Pseudomonadota bacterium]
FSDGRVKHSKVNPIDSLGIDPWTINADSAGVVTKINWNHSIYPSGYKTTDNSFVNNATRGANERLFGWGSGRGPASQSNATTNSGFGATELGQLIANSQKFPECMAQRSFEALCHKEVGSSSTNARHARAFIDSNYNFKSLFKSIAMDSSCWEAL